MLVLTGVFDRGMFIPDEPAPIPQGTKVRVMVEEESATIKEKPASGRAQRLLGACANLGDITLEQIREERLSKYL